MVTCRSIKVKGFLNGGSFLFVNFTLAIMKPTNKNYFKEVTMNKEKIKKFWKENKSEIMLGVGLTVGWIAGGMICGNIMYKAGLNDAIPWDTEGREVITKIIATGAKGKYPIGWLIENDGIETKDLGKFGERLIESGCSSDKKFMRFIAISDEVVGK